MKLLHPFRLINKITAWLTCVLCISALSICTLCSCRSIPQKNTYSQVGFYYDTVIKITLYDCESKSSAQEILSNCMETASFYENLFSPTIEGSDIWNINHSHGAVTTVHADTASLLQSALDYARLSEGIVDPTIGSLTQLWNFGSENEGILPKDTDITTALSHVNYHCLEITENQIRLSDPEAQLELGFIAKGFIADKLKAQLLSDGISSATISLGGNIVTVGAKPDGSPFHIGIQDPFASTGTPILEVDSTDSSIVSSGNYERYFEKDGKRYHHILSSQTGYPSQSGLAQVTILHEDSTLCDAFSTYCFLLGYEKSALLLKQYPEIQAVFITEGGDIQYINFY